MKFFFFLLNAILHKFEGKLDKMDVMELLVVVEKERLENLQPRRQIKEAKS